tara:strand:- start:111 stop:449 length:339 start_codon:yes stop_codon:yes gene_type:complete
MAYASGKKAKAICDRCGFEYKFHDLKEEWNGLKTCPTCFEPKHPQLKPLPHVMDPEALYKPRPNNDIEAGEGFVVVIYTNIKKGNDMSLDIVGSNFNIDKMTGSLGEVTITV